MNMKERLARAICASMGDHPDRMVEERKWTNPHSTNYGSEICKPYPAWKLYIKRADVMLEEMLNPTDDMIDSVYGKNDVLRERDIVERDFKIMIQAAIDGK